MIPPDRQLESASMDLDALGPAFEIAKKTMGEKSLLGRVCTPDDVRDAILGFLEGLDLVTGQVLVVDGGLGIAA